jgi:hypothetical protein
MRAEDTEKSLRLFLKSKGRDLKTFSAHDVLLFGTEHWLTTQIDGLRPENGDGLVAYFEVLNRGRGTLFEFGLNRIMTVQADGAAYVPWLPAYKLRLSVAFKATLEVFQLGPVTCAFTCWSKDAVGEFLGKVRASGPFQLVTEYEQHFSGISLAECGAPWGEPVHPTQGLTWAIA